MAGVIWIRLREAEKQHRTVWGPGALEHLGPGASLLTAPPITHVVVWCLVRVSWHLTHFPHCRRPFQTPCSHIQGCLGQICKAGPLDVPFHQRHTHTQPV